MSLSLFLFFFLLEKNTFLTPILLLIFIIFQIYSLYRYVDKTNRDLTSFLESIRFSEFTRSFRIEGMGSSFDELNRAFNDVINDFQKVRSEKEEHFHYLQSIVQNIDISILAYREDGSVEMINKAAKKLFQVTNLSNIDRLETLSAELVNTLRTIKPGESKLVKVQDQDDFLQLAINTSEFRLKDRNVTLATVKNIQNVLEEQETEAWQKLIRVLTHEIMNSITPIGSLSSTLETMLKPYTSDDPDAQPIDSETILEIQQALKTINKRSLGLLHFVNTYRNLTRIPKPNFRITKVADLFSNIEKLMVQNLEKSGIRFSVNIEPPGLEISMDEQLIEQVLINLVQNSIQALENRPSGLIRMKAFYNKRGRPTIQVIDNGTGIIQEVLDKIFIPFFTTRPNGSGIGLSLSRQILRLHGGSITAQSVPEKETIFTLSF